MPTESYFAEVHRNICGNQVLPDPPLNLEAICEKHLAGRYRIEVVDLVKQPQLARGDQIVAVPTLVRRLPPPMKRIIGDLSDQDSVLVGLDLRSRPNGRRTKAKP